MHVLVWDGDVLVAHGSVVQRRMLHHGRALRTGYVEGVAVREDRRRRGHATRVMEAVERLVRGGYDLGALSASDAAARLYAGRGWQPWQGRTYVLSPEGIRRTEEDDDGVFVLPVAGAPLDVAGDLVCDWREGDVW